MAITYENLKLLPFEHSFTKDIKITKQINEHGVLKYTGIIPQKVKDDYVISAKFGTTIQLIQGNKDNEKTIFDGVLVDIKVYSYGEVYYMEVLAYTRSYLMDIQIKKRSFQDINMQYRTLVNKITKEYSRGDFLYTLDENPPLGGFILQYMESDWNFLRRLCSHFNQGLYPSCNIESTSFFFGPPKIDSGESLDTTVFYASKNLQNYKFLSENYVPGVMDLDFVEYEVESDVDVDLGIKVKFKSIDFHVKKVEIKMEGGILKHRYTICTKRGLKQKRLENEKVQGVSIIGEVIDVRRDTVKVHLGIDKSQDIGEAYWFPYQAMYASDDGSGWYCMPEKGDAVRVTIPNRNEKNAFAVSSVSKYMPEEPSQVQSKSTGVTIANKSLSSGGGQDRMADPKIRWIRNPQGMEVKLTPQQVIISANGRAYIALDQNGNIIIYGRNEIIIKSEEYINIESIKSMFIQAQEDIRIESSLGSYIEMDKDGKIEIKGQQVSTN